MISGVTWIDEDPIRAETEASAFLLCHDPSIHQSIHLFIYSLAAV